MSFLVNFKNRFKSIKQRVAGRIGQYFSFLKTNLWAGIIFYIILIAPPLLVLSIVVVGPLFLDPFTSVRDDPQTAVQIDPTLVRLQTDEYFFLSQLKLAKSDSIGLVIDLIDSSAILQIKGVKIRECKIRQIKMGRAFRKMQRENQMLVWLSLPFTLEKEWSTVPKAPIKIKKAPKDTAEANQMIDTTRTVEKSDVYCTIRFDRNCILRMNQIESPSLIGRVRYFYYYLRREIFYFQEAFHSLFHLRLSSPPLWIELVLTQNDIKAIYRALPKNGGMALRLYGDGGR